MYSGQRRGSSSNRQKGFTLIEMLVTLGIISILAAVAVPYAERTMKRSSEMELQSSLRQIRTAIDRFYEDWTGGKISKLCECAGESGYPLDLLVLTQGADTGGATGKKIKYLRRIPRDPFADQSVPLHEQWGLRSYREDPSSRAWSGEDVYDVYTKSEKKAMDGSMYADW